VIDPGRLDAGVPRGTAALALEIAARAAGAVSTLTGRRYVVDPAAVLAHVLLPLVVGDTPEPAAPRPAPGGGWVHADLLAEDEALFTVLAEHDPDAERWAAAAQECRLPVTPYRDPPRSCDGAVPAVVGCTNAKIRVEPCAVRVLDLTAMWAGPLATMQLAGWGARVTTVEPVVRPDGLRSSPAQFGVLDTGKRRVRWDLRMDEGRAAFEEGVRQADVLVESFSDRVMTNLGYDRAGLRRLNPELVVVAVRAFPHGSDERSWVAYGRGVHAASGLGIVAGLPQPALVAYPDPLAGLSAFAAVLAALAEPGPHDVDVSLAGAIAPLVGTRAPIDAVDDDAIDALREATAGRPGAVIVAT